MINVASVLPASASDHLWLASGMPEPQWPVVARVSAPCATCGVTTNTGVAIKTFATNTFSREADFLRFGDAVCVPCAWMYSDPKRRHRSVLAIDDAICWPALGADSAIDGRPTWRAALDALLAAPSGSAVTGVLTTDPKPRLWPLTRITTAARPGLYVHSPDHDLSGFVALDPTSLAGDLGLVADALARGYSKRAVMLGLPTHKAFGTSPTEGLRLERQLAPRRRDQAFVVAVLASLARAGT